MLSGEFGAHLLVPFTATTMLLTLLGAGMWADRLGGREVWRVPVAALLGLAVGVVLAAFRIDLPQLHWGMAIAVIAIGMLVALQAGLPSAVALAIVALAAVYHGQGVLFRSPRPPLGWAGVATGAVLVLAAGIGLASIIGRVGGSHRVIQVTGLAIAGAGGLVLFGIVR